MNAKIALLLVSFHVILVISLFRIIEAEFMRCLPIVVKVGGRIERDCFTDKLDKGYKQFNFQKTYNEPVF